MIVKERVASADSLFLRMDVSLDFKFQFVELALEMQNEKCKMQNCGISSGNDLNPSAKPTQSFYILHSVFCIRAAYAAR